MNQGPTSFNLTYRETDFKVLYFGKSVIKSYFSTSRSRTMIVALLSAAGLMLILQFGGSNYFLVSPIFVLTILSTFYIWKMLTEFYAFRKWKMEVDEYVKKGSAFQNSIVQLERDHFILESKTTASKLIIAYKGITALDKHGDHIVLNEVSKSAVVLPMAAFENESEYHKFCTLLESKVLSASPMQ